MREYLLYCSDCAEYTALGKFQEKEGRFEGEYSLLHNRRLQNDELLCRFLLRHVGHHLKSIPNKTDEYSSIIQTAHRFMEMEIDHFVEQAMEREQERANDLLMERGLGQLQLNILYKLLEDEARSIASTPTSTSAESQFLLGKEEGIKRAVAILKDLLERTNMLYK